MVILLLTLTMGKFLYWPIPHREGLADCPMVCVPGTASFARGTPRGVRQHRLDSNPLPIG
jgi:hypothetical protein